jgi:hypothetical protein
MTQHFNAAGVEQTSQKVTYRYDVNNSATGLPENARGRLTSVKFSNETPGSPEQFTYLYTYTPTGHVTTQRLQIGTTGNTTVNLDATYTRDNEGRMTSMTPPGGVAPA